MVGQGSITQSDLEYMLVDETTEPIALPLSLLSEITDDFSLEIGSGGFSIVYKATLENGTIAVKKLSNTHMYEKEFHREVECLMKVKHKNIVRFLGYCADTQGNMKSHKGRLVMGDVQQRLLCFEYLPKGSLDAYIKDSSRELEWRECYQVIKGICEGLNYLHQENVLHLDLKPGNILLDEDMMPKITDFGLSRCVEENQTRLITKGVGGTLGYLAPEFESGEITHKFDLYSLGVIIIEMLTGKKGYQNIQDVLDIWKNTMVDPLQWEQIQVCARIGIECKEADPAKRPSSMKHIIDSLDETECRTHVNLAGGTSELLLPHQFTLCFPFEPNKVITFPLHLTNNTDKHIAFRLIDKSMDPSFLSLPLYGIVPPKTPYTLVVTTQETEQQPRKHIIDVVLHSATLILGNEMYYVNAFQSRPDTYFQEMENEVQKVKLKALYTLTRGIATSLSKPVSPTTKIICMVKVGSKYSLDTNEAKQWIVIGDDSGHVGFWDYQTQRKVDSLKVSVSATNAITCVKFIARKQWIVAGTGNGNVHVYNYETMQKITSFKTGEFVSLVSLAVHPTQSYLLSVGTYMKLWDWDKGWECAQTFNSKHKFSGVAFNGNDTFATILTGAEDVKIWNLDSKESKYALYGHLYRVNCLDFFTCQDQEFLVTGSDDKTAKIWNWQKKICARTLDCVSPVTSVLYQPNLQTLITGSEGGAIYLWSTKNCGIYSRLPMPKRIIKIGCAGYVYHLACAMERVVIGKGNVVAVMDIDKVNYQEQSTDHSEQQLSVDTRQHAGDTTSKEIAGSINKLLDVFPQELRFPYHSNEPNPCSIHLTNNTDENVAFRLVDRSRKSPWWFAELPLYGIVPHRSTYTLIVTMKEEMKLKTEIDFDLVVQSTLVADKYEVFEDKSESDHFFVETKECGKMVHEVTLKAVYLQYKEITSENTTLNLNRDPLCSLDSHPTELWILTGHDSGYACVWNNEMKYPMSSFKVSEAGVSSVKFIARKEWIVAVTRDSDLHVYDCASVTKIEKIMHVKAAGFKAGRPVLAVHPTLACVLTSGYAELLDWDQAWKQTQKFQTSHDLSSGGGLGRAKAGGRVAGRQVAKPLPFAYFGRPPSLHLSTVAFIPGDHNRFASGSFGGKLQVWRLDSENPEYRLPAHLEEVNCLDFIRRGDQHYLVSGSTDCTAKIWDLQKRECICTLQAMSPASSLCPCPSKPSGSTYRNKTWIHPCVELHQFQTRENH